jgi:hypothetical protein
MLEKVDVDFYETYAFSGIPSIKLNNDLFYGGFSIGGIIDETIYFPVVYHYTEKTFNGVRQSLDPEPVALTRCTLDKFGKRFQPLFADRQLDYLYCMEDVHETLAGYSNLDEYSYYYIMIMPCIGYNLRGEQCQPLENVTAFFQQTHLEFKMQDVVMTPKDYDNPSLARNMDIQGPVFSFLYQSIYTYMQIVNLEKCNGTFIISGNNSLIYFYLPLTKNDSYKVIENEDNFELSNITLFFFIPKKNEFNSINIILINLVIILLILHIILNMELFHILEILKKNIF